MLNLQLRKGLTSITNYSAISRVVLPGTRSKSEAAKPALKSPFDAEKAAPRPSPFADASRDVQKDTKKDVQTENPTDRSSGIAPFSVTDECKITNADPNYLRGGLKTSLTGTMAQNSTSDLRVMEFEDIPCPLFIKWTSKVLSYVPALGTQVTANLARNGLLPIRRLLNTHGPVVRLSGLLGGPILLVSRPDLLEAVFSEEGKEPEGLGFDSLRHYRQLRRTSTTAAWPSKAATTGEPFSSVQTRAAFAEATARVDGPLLSGLEHAADKFVTAVSGTRSPQGEVDVQAAMRYWALESASVAAFGQTLSDALGGIEADVERTHNAFVTASDALRSCEGGLQLWRWFPTWSWPRLETSLDQLHRILGKRVWAEHGRFQQEGLPERPTCVLDALLQIGLHPDAAIDTILELVLVAGNTTACAGSMLLYELARHPRYQRSVLDEVRAQLPSLKGTLQGGTSRMTLLHACIKETLRLHPPVPTLTRVLPRPARLHQYHVPQGTVVVLASAQCARRPDQFEDAECFRPRRWLEEDPGRHPLAGLPWGGGSRGCPAAPIAATQLALLAAKTISAFHLEHDYGPVQLTGEVLARPSRPLRLRFIDRMS